MLKTKYLKELVVTLLLISTSLLANKNEIKFENNVEEAFKIAMSEKKSVLVYFSGSDWCRPCMQLHKEVFESESFSNFTASNLVIVRLDFPAKSENKLSEEQTEYNNSMAKELNKKGIFPLMILFDSNNNNLIEIAGYNRLGSEKIIEQFKSKMQNDSKI